MQRASAQYPEVVPDTAPQVVAPSYPEAVPPSSPLPTYHRNGWDSDKVPIIYHDSNLQAVQHTYNDLYALSPTPDPADNAPESAHPWSSKAGAGNTVCGLRRKWFWTGLVVLLVIGAAVVAAAVGATVAHRHNNKAARTRAGHNASAGDHDETTSAPLKDVNLTRYVGSIEVLGAALVLGLMIGRAHAIRATGGSMFKIHVRCACGCGILTPKPSISPVANCAYDGIVLIWIVPCG